MYNDPKPFFRILLTMTSFICLSEFFPSNCQTEQTLLLAREKKWEQVLNIVFKKKIDRRSQQSKELYTVACLQKNWAAVGELLKHGIELPSEAEDLGHIALNEETIRALCHGVLANQEPTESSFLSIYDSKNAEVLGACKIEAKSARFL